MANLQQPIVAKHVSSTSKRFRSFSSVGASSECVSMELKVFARLPPSCPYVGSFHYAPSAGNRAYSFFEGQIIPSHETDRVHRIKTNPLTGNFHSRPGHYSRLHGLQNFRSVFEGLSAAEDGMTAIIARIKNSLTEPSPPATKPGATHINGEPSKGPRALRSRALKSTGKPPHLRLSNNTLRFFHKPLSVCDLSSISSAAKTEKEDTTGRRAAYAKYWEKANTERGRFGSSVDDHALGASSQQPAVAGPAAVADDLRVEAAIAAGLHGLGKGIVHWGKHHHHHAPGSDQGQEATDAKLRLMYLRQKRQPRSRAMVYVDCASTKQVATFSRGGPDAGARVRGYRGVGDAGGTRRRSGSGKRRTERESRNMARRNPDGIFKVNPGSGAAASGRVANTKSGGGVRAGVACVAPRSRQSTSNGQGWESHTLKAQQKMKEYMQGRKDLAPDMRPDVVLENEVSLAYDVDVSEVGVLGAGSYGTVRAAVHRSTGRQVAIKTMLKKYLFSEAEKASVEREIEIQKRLVNNHVIRLYEIYQSPEKLYLVVERAPFGSLEEYLYLRCRLTELDAKRVIRQLLEGLTYLHKSGIVHCDLKPANILFSHIDQGANTSVDPARRRGKGDGKLVPRAQATTPSASLSGLVVKICDFGHARKVPDCRYYKFTGDINKIPFHMFKLTGTDGFVAPEVLKSEPYGKAADMWSTGCMLYQMLTGRMPWIPSRACLQRPLCTSGPSWKRMGSEARSLVKDLLTADQNLRANVEQATRHPWFEDFHHCAKMPTSAPDVRLFPSISRQASCPAGFSASRLAPPRGKGVHSGDVAAGGGGGGGFPGCGAKIGDKPKQAVVVKSRTGTAF